MGHQSASVAAALPAGSPPPAGAPPSAISRDTQHLYIPLVELSFHEPVGSGTFGAVYRAEWTPAADTKSRFDALQLTAPAEIAVKVMALDPEHKRLRQEFLNEVALLAAAAATERPRSVRFFGWSESADGKSAYICMEYLPLGDLKKFGASRAWRDMKFDDKWELLCSMVSSIAHLHSLNIHHRDIKPNNFLVHFDEVTKVYSIRASDLGLCKALWTHASSVAPAPNSAVGTAPYSAPEWLGLLVNDYHTSMDVFSLGITMWELLLGGGAQPWGGRPIDFWKGDVVNGKRLPLLTQPQLQHIPELYRPHVVRLIESCWHQDAGRRPTCDQVLYWMQHIDDHVHREKLVGEVKTAASHGWTMANTVIDAIIESTPLFTTAQVHSILHSMIARMATRNYWDDWTVKRNILEFYKHYYDSTTDDALCLDLLEQRVDPEDRPAPRPRDPPTYLLQMNAAACTPADVVEHGGRPASPLPAAAAAAPLVGMQGGVYNSQQGQNS